jgi:hypothetical protein
MIDCSCATLLLKTLYFTTYNMSKVDLRVKVEHIKAKLHPSNTRMIGSYHATNFIYPSCDLFDNEEPTERLTLFVMDDLVNCLSDDESPLSAVQFIESSDPDTVFTFDATVKHNMYGTMKATGVSLTGYQSK